MTINLEQAKQALLALKQELETRIDKIEDHTHHPQDDLNEHWDDQAISYQENDMRQNLLIEAQEELVEVKSALLRIENGSYGECLECEEEIESKRLQAVPYAKYCMKHAN
ncbi:MAG: TraR/DksA C4-type zinc finger protein [Moraxellaceae bacterium]|nr:TraR/DksA C4-type zinc finger protein [Moraxellaceae bacterium]